MPAETGFPRADVEDDFLRARRRQVLARLAHRLRREPDDVNLILPFDEVVAALGMKGERSLGLRTVRLDSVVGTVDSQRDFDRRFRPTSNRVRERWERLALAQRRGESIPPIEVYRVGDLHFVKDGHHRVSIALATGQTTIEAYVTEVLTSVPAQGIRRRGDLLLKSYERIFRSRVPLPAQAYAKISVTDAWSYAELGEAVEAWGFGLAGFKGLGLTGGSIPRMGPTASGYHDTGGSATLHFPDGNATIARLLLRKLIPDAIPGHTAEDIVTARGLQPPGSGEFARARAPEQHGCARAASRRAGPGARGRSPLRPGRSRRFGPSRPPDRGPLASPAATAPGLATALRDGAGAWPSGPASGAGSS